MFAHCTFVDGLSIPLFSVGRRILTISRSLVVEQPDCLRRDAPQVDTERAVHAGEDASGVIAEESREWQKWEESPGLSELAGSAPEGFKAPRRAVKIDVCTTFYRGISESVTLLTHSFSQRFPELVRSRTPSSYWSVLGSPSQKRLKLHKVIADTRHLCGIFHLGRFDVHIWIVPERDLCLTASDYALTCN